METEKQNPTAEEPTTTTPLPKSVNSYKRIFKHGTEDQIKAAEEELRRHGYEWDFIRETVVNPAIREMKTEAQKAYEARLFGKAVEEQTGIGSITSFIQTRTRRRSGRPDIIDYATTRKYLWEAYRLLVYNKTNLQLESKNLPTFLKPILKNATDWIIGNKEGAWDPSRSLYFYGGLGTGKSTIAEAIHHVLCFYKVKTGWTTRYLSYESLENIALEALSEEKLNRMSRFGTGGWILDDIKPELYFVNHFGEDYELVKRVLHARYQAWSVSGYQTIITSNTPFEAFIDRNDSTRGIEDPRLIDRVKEQFIPVEFKGRSFRSPAARLNP